MIKFFNKSISNNITFTNMMNIQSEFMPKPASSVIPQWYKDTDSYIGNIKKPDGTGHTTATVKRCMPVFDSLTAGYIIASYSDLYISTNTVVDKNGKEVKETKFESSGIDAIQFHPFSQADKHPYGREGLSYPKLMNPWGIKTPKGYSSLFVQPFHRESPITILPGIVDTDKYNAPVNFPFIINDLNFEGLIPAGTPIAQVIPFKRDSWAMSLGEKNDFDLISSQSMSLRSRFFDNYKNYFRSNKEYR